MNIPSRIQEVLMMVAGLAVVGASPPCLANTVPAGSADKQSAQTRVPAAVTKAQPESKPQVVGTPATAAPAEPAAESTETNQVESKPPQVTYKDGELTIAAENATLSEVLAGVRTAMGADIDLPSGSTGQRIWVRLGPGPARTVLRDLLDGTEFNYVIQASENDSDGIRSVLLTLRSKNPEPGNTANAGTQLARGPIRNGQPGSSGPTTEAPEPETTAAATPATTAPAPAVAAADTASAPPEVPSPPSVQAAASNLPMTQGSAMPGISSPGGGNSEQMMQQLQSMYEQRRQLQIQLNQSTKPQGSN